MSEPHSYELHLIVNGHVIKTVLVGRHYVEKHGDYLNDELLLNLVSALSPEIKKEVGGF